jgi:hypothetical protein
LPKTGIQIFQLLKSKNPNNGTYQYNFNGENVTKNVVFEGLALIDDNRNVNPNQNTQFGEQRQKGIEIYLPNTNFFDGLENKLPELVVNINPNSIHSNNVFNPALTVEEFKVISITRPNGIRLKHLQLHCESAS